MGLGYLALFLDDTEHGFGWLSLYAAPVLLISGWLAIPFFIGNDTAKPFRINLKKVSLTAILAFIIPLIMYLITMPKTASLWDCPEYIAAAFRLQIPHSPGNPLFLLVGRIFSMWFEHRTEWVSISVNTMSALFSAGTVLIFYSIIKLLAEHSPTKLSETNRSVIALGSALILAFLDTFWFSAVEAEIYSMATFFMTVQLWFALKCYTKKNTDPCNWIMLAWLTGGAAAVHPMALLAAPPAIFLMFMTKKSWDWINILKGFAISMGILLFINHFLFSGWLRPAILLDRFLVNSWNWPLWSGVLLGFIILSVAIIILVRLTLKKNKEWQKILLKSFIVLYAGLAFYWIIPLRSNSLTPINSGGPDTPPDFVFYLDRESYGSRPLWYGPYHDARVAGVAEKEVMYGIEGGRYIVKGERTHYAYDPDRQTILPRMYSTQEKHIEDYKRQTGLQKGQEPSFRHNLAFLLHYQLGHMFTRYLLWNFAGRAHDAQHAEWLAPWNSWINDQSFVSDNAAHNQYFMLPLLLALIGFWWLYRNNKPLLVFIVYSFLIMGPLLVFYLNAPPVEPRERDYIYVGAFMSFAMLIPFSALALISRWPKYARWFAFIPFFLACWIALENFDDHNRHGRKLHIEHARALLESCEPNAILFTGGDNDTFPLWYLQEVEQVRTDIRVIVLSYFNADWYIEQLSNPVRDADGIPITLEQKHYRQYSLNDYLPVVERKGIRGPIRLDKFLQLIENESGALQKTFYTGNTLNTVPYPAFSWNYNDMSVRIDLKDKYLEKNGLVLLDILNSNDDSRPIYFNMTSLNNIGLELNPHIVKEGFLYRLRPNATEDIDLEKTADVLLVAEFSTIESKVYYHFEDHYLRVIQPLRNAYYQTANYLIENGNKKDAGRLMEKIINLLPYTYYAPGIQEISAIEALEKLGDQEAADKLANLLYENAREEIQYLKKANYSNNNIPLYIINYLAMYFDKRNFKEKREGCLEILRDKG
mgnify:FL=1